jgi:hypothetical protein
MLWLFNNVLSVARVYLKLNEARSKNVCDEAERSHTSSYYCKNELKKKPNQEIK